MLTPEQKIRLAMLREKKRLATAKVLPELGIMSRDDTDLFRPKETITKLPPPPFEPSAFDPENVFGTVGGILASIVSGGTLNEAGAAFGGEIGQTIEEAWKARNIPNYDTEQMASNIREAGFRQAGYETVGRAISPVGGRIIGQVIRPIKWLGQKLIGKAGTKVISDIVTKEGRKVVTKPVPAGLLRDIPLKVEKAIADRLGKNIIAGSVESQKRLIDVAGRALSPEDAAQITMTPADVTGSKILQVVEAASKNALGGKSIANIKKNQITTFERMLVEAQGKITTGDVIPDVPVVMTNPLKKAGILTPQKLGQKVGEVVNLENDLFHQTMSKKYEEQLSPMAINAFKSADIVDVSNFNQEAIKRVEESKYLADLGSEGLSILKKAATLPIKPEKELSGEASTVIALLNSGKTQEEIIEMFATAAESVDRAKLPAIKAAMKEIIPNKKMPFEKAIDLDRQLNAAYEQIFLTPLAKDEKRTLLASYAALKSELRSAMEEAAEENGGEGVWHYFVGLTDEFAEGAERFNSKFARQAINEFQQSPSQVMNMLEGKDAATTLEYAKSALGEQSDEVLTALKETYADQLFKTKVKLDTVTNTYIPDITAIQKSLQELDPVARKMLFTDSEFKFLNKNLNIGIAKETAMDAIKSPQTTMSFLHGKQAVETMNYILDTLGDTEGDRYINEMKNKWLEEVLRISKEPIVESGTDFAEKTVPKLVQNEIDKLSPVVRDILFNGRKGELELFKKVVNQGLIQEAPPILGPFGKYMIGLRQVQTAIGIAGIGTGAVTYVLGGKKKGTAISGLGLVLLFGPPVYAKYAGNREFVNLILKIEKPTLEQIPQRITHMKELYKMLISDPAMAEYVRLVDLSNKPEQINQFPSAKQKAGK